MSVSFSYSEQRTRVASVFEGELGLPSQQEVNEILSLDDPAEQEAKLTDLAVLTEFVDGVPQAAPHRRAAQLNRLRITILCEHGGEHGAGRPPRGDAAQQVRRLVNQLGKPRRR